MVVTRLARLARFTRDLLDIAEFERALIHQRSSSGRQAAKARRVRFGRPPKLAADQIALGERLGNKGISVREASKRCKCHHATHYRALTAAALAPEGLA
jgi:DNA invertase Pin-like site-specific DNA recombinase